jgi:exodeoxyribonuclease VII large subunit
MNKQAVLMAATKDRTVYTVTELTRDLRAVLETAFQSVWVEGEVSNYIMSSSGHAYFSLKDDQSILKCVLFKNAVSGKASFTIEDGMHLLCGGRISVYGQRGAYQLYVDSLEPRGKGALGLAFEQLKKRLAKEGLFDEARKRPLPFLPVHVGIVTSPTGAAIRDILKVIKRRFANTEVTLRPVKVQGDTAKDEIALAIKELNEYNEQVFEDGSEEHPIDVMIVGRGGGSLEDLWSFNEEVVARAIFQSKIPVVSAVGHEIDYTISDFVADLRAPTPSAAAEIVVPRRQDVEGRLGEMRERLLSAVRGHVGELERSVTSLRESYVLKGPVNVFLQMKQRVDDLLRAASASMAHTADIKFRELGTACGKLRVLSPLAVLERGYSITFKGGEVLKDTKDLKKGDAVVTKLAEGVFTSRVEEVEK